MPVESTELNFIIQKRGEEWCLISKSTGKTLGCHGSKEKAEEQERAIKAQAVSEKTKVLSFTDIRGVEIFASGTWNDDVYTDEDLDSIVDSFMETKDLLKPYLKLGHSKDQQLLSEDELPAAGFIDRIYRRGKKLVADFVNIPSKIYELIKRGAYKRVSSELFVNFKANGKEYPYALKAVALLGGETPAVHTLDDILSLYRDINHIVTYETDSISKAYEFDGSFTIDEGVNQDKEATYMATLEEVLRQNAKLEAEVKSFQDENAALEKDLEEANKNLKEMGTQLKEFKDKSAALESEIEKAKKEAFDKEIDMEVKSYADAGKIVPAQEPFLKALLKNARMDSQTKEFTIGEKKYSDVKSLVKGFIDSHVDIDLDDAKSKMEQINDSNFVAKVNKYAKDKGITVREATLELSESK